MANLKQHIQLQQQQQHQQQLQPPSPPPPPPPPPQQQKPGSSPLQPSWIPSSVRRNCDYCVKKKVKCVGNSNGAGCNICVRKSIRCEYSVKKKPGPKCRKREDEEGDDEAIRSPIPSSSIIHNGGQAHILTSPSRGAAAAAAAAVAAAAAAAARPQSAYALHRGGRSASFEAEHGGEYGGGAAVGGGGSRSLVSSPSSEHLLTPSKKARPTHDKGTRAARRHVEEEKRQPFVQQQPQLLQPVAPIVSPWRWNQSDDSLRTTLFNGRGMTPNHDLRRRASMSALPQPITPGTGAVGGGGAADEGVGSNSLHAGGGPPVTPPSAFRGLSPPNSAASASGVNVRYGAVLDGGVLEGLGGSGGGGYDARVGSGGGQPFGQSPPPDGAGGGRAGSLNGLGIANGGSFVGGFEVGERVHLEKLFQQQVLDPVDVAVPDGSDVSDVSTNISENSDDENGPRGSTNADGTPVRRTGGSRHRHRVRGAEPAGGGAAERDGAGGTGTSSGDGTGGSAGDSGAGGALNRPNFCDSINGAAAFNGPGAGNGRSDGAWGGGVGSEQQQQQLLQQQNHGQGQSQQQQLEQQQRRQFWQRHVQQQQQQQLQEMQQQMQQQQRSATDAPCSPHHQAHGHHRHRKRAPKAGSASSAPQIPTAAQQQQQQQQQQMLLHPPTLPRLGSSDSSWRGLLDTPAIIHGNSSSGGDDSSPVAPLRHPSFSGFADGGSGGSGGSGGPGAPGAEATIGRGPTPPMHVYDSSPLAGASGENSLGGANGQQWGRVAMQNGAGGSVGGDDRSGSLSWGERGGSFSEAGVAAGGGVGGSSGVASGGGGAGGNGAAGSEVGGNGNSGIGGCPPFVSDVGVGMGVIGPAALHTGTGSHARSYSYGFGEWLPPADVTLDEDLDFLAGMSDEILPSGTEILAGRDHHF